VVGLVHSALAWASLSGDFASKLDAAPSPIVLGSLLIQLLCVKRFQESNAFTILLQHVQVIVAQLGLNILLIIKIGKRKIQLLGCFDL
jgi:hypothetical protein